ncbi:hypothetical protein HU200_016367 [Digitaria exilis]|uniref:F-box domain-containing protein n=1 Tax=Digitaria exilis TaxID=1010633 RepID=A0A835F897_9POAL|nr:hypothetical protein HU200_016367 [Digitaria exilis]
MLTSPRTHAYVVPPLLRLSSNRVPPPRLLLLFSAAGAPSPGGARARRVGVVGAGDIMGRIRTISGVVGLIGLLQQLAHGGPVRAPMPRRIWQPKTTRIWHPNSARVNCQIANDATRNCILAASNSSKPKKHHGAAAPELMDELVEEVLLRLPLDSPAHLVGAALVCRRWRRLVSGAGFRRRLRAFHRSPPMLGFLCNIQNTYMTHLARFVPTTASSCSPHAGDHHGGWRADDARHGRVLLSRRMTKHLVLMVWDPITDHRQELPPIRPRPLYSYKAAIVCASIAACDHLDCHRGGPFLVVYIGVGHDGASFSCVYSSDAASWSKPVSLRLPLVNCINLVTCSWEGALLHVSQEQPNAPV